MGGGQHAARRRWWRGLCAAAGLAWLQAAGAQTVMLEPTAAQRCLVPAADERGVPEYPFDAWKRERSGRVVVNLTFTTPETRPVVKVQLAEGEGDSADAFVEAVRVHVSRWRVPCMQAAGNPVQLQLEFVFNPTSKQVFGSAPADLDDERRERLLKCVRHARGNETPDYPLDALRRSLQGSVLARLHFNAADKAPQVQLLARNNALLLRDSVESHLAGLRMPCHDNQGGVDATFTYVFRINGVRAIGFRPLGLTGLMSHIKGIREQRVAFDTTTMGCPFDVKFQYRQPYMNNWVSAGQAHKAERQPLLSWLAQAHLDLPSRSLDAVFGDETVVSVPCAKIDIVPKETS